MLISSLPASRFSPAPSHPRVGLVPRRGLLVLILPRLCPDGSSRARVFTRALGDGDLYLSCPSHFLNPLFPLGLNSSIIPHFVAIWGEGCLFWYLLMKVGFFAVEGGNSVCALMFPSSCFDDRWISVLTNSKEEALTMAFRGEQSAGENSLEDLTKAIIEDVQRLPGNDVCCDCGSSGICFQSEASSSNTFPLPLESK